MSTYIGKLPESFRWEFHDQADPGMAPARLVLGGRELALVKPMGRAWVAIVNPAYSPGGYPACIVPNRAKGQAWLARWVRHSVTGIQSACAEQGEDAHDSATWSDTALARAGRP